MFEELGREKSTGMRLGERIEKERGGRQGKARREKEERGGE